MESDRTPEQVRCQIGIGGSEKLVAWQIYRPAGNFAPISSMVHSSLLFKLHLGAAQNPSSFFD
jgi:hypothetical protein